MAVTAWFVKNHTNTNTRTHNHTTNKSFTTWILSKQFFLLKLWASPANLITQQLDPNLLARQDQTRSQSRGSDIGLKNVQKKKIKKGIGEGWQFTFFVRSSSTCNLSFSILRSSKLMSDTGPSLLILSRDTWSLKTNMVESYEPKSAQRLKPLLRARLQ